MSGTPPRVLVIAGSDSSGGAGIQADIKTVTMRGGYAMTAITAITAQNTTGVQAVDLLSPALIVAQIDSCLADIGADAVKIGMLGSAAAAQAVAVRLAQTGLPFVFDPVMVATSGAVLADADTIAAFGRLMRLARVVTPNLPELEALAGTSLRGDAEVAAAARTLAAGHGCAVLAKGGHGDGGEVVDWLVTPDGDVTRFAGPRIDTRHTHGTGCTLASALATEIGRGASLADAVDTARRFVAEALRAAPGLGAGAGPLGHQAVGTLRQASIS
ncbi:bifunctional hydroxymethylpyrimidine kinase/phosphomethylpyrimidine kinase [Erythrobacteraceae bacterium CFH 75059]|uniref:bifunctional hydroxymethylpyrimidine kinase/phosphomethylpyrimidine kinase n=1 Tax=Qipengyuania thermophila TaxID=2509361 RepID=UPI001020A379|nr:bifunctional hydroxymethylpyrimidine kinase/phosphomethylpyrimidine kinase [Qipengyuania thermophila]TCD06799.1 bifunctional hydroxymethylpyrimidine kinase/phosphomethylpyrimidine kinase [Erythrobacteraceae bacterium CFH 75059]